jgi:hypothetical protein
MSRWYQLSAKKQNARMPLSSNPGVTNLNPSDP